MRNRILTKEVVLDAAEKVIINEGMAQCSMRRIASELGVAVGTLYNYYDSREALLVDLFTISWKRTIKGAENVVDASQGRWHQLEQFFDVINEDVKNRHGLGKEIYIFNSFRKESNEGVLNIQRALLQVVEEILNQKKGAEVENKVLSGWIMTLLVDALVNEREMTPSEMKMLAQVIEVDFDLSEQ